MGALHPLDHTGDSKTIWDPDKPEEVEAAQAVFDKLKAKGYAAFRVDEKGGKAGQMRKFDPAAEKLIMVPQLQGG